MFDPATFVALRDRHPVYKQLRDEAPVFEARFGPAPVWLLTRYEDVSALLKDPTARVKSLEGNPAGFENGPAKTMFDAQMVLSDPPDHDRLRKLASPAFTLATLRPLQAWLEDIVERRIALLAGRDSFDIVADLAAYVPAATILKILGLTEDDWEPLISRVPAFLHIFSPFPLPEKERDACNDACQFYLDFFGDLIERRSKDPADDIVGKLITARLDEDRLSHVELLAMLHTFLNAGYETTMSTLGAGLWGMLKQREPWERLVADPSLAPVALEEILRWEAPVSFLRRYPTQDMELHGVTIRAGEPCLLALASANRDERRFAGPDRIDLDRPTKEHVSFGGGRHFCIGFQLAKLEARTTLAALARGLPDLHLIDTDPDRAANIMFHSVERLRVATSPHAARPAAQQGALQ
jgi:cytochrome P450